MGNSKKEVAVFLSKSRKEGVVLSFFVLFLFNRMPFLSLLASQAENKRHPSKMIGFTELVDEIFFVGVKHEVGVVDKEHKGRRLIIHLSHVVDAQAFALNHGRVHFLHA